MSDAGRKVRLLISDVDGTLVTHEKLLTPGTIAAVARLRAAGIGFTLVSARPPSGLRRLAETLDVRLPMAAYNGGILLDGDGSFAERHPIDPVAALEFQAMVGAAPVSWWIFADGIWHADDLANPHVPRERLSSDQEPVIAPPTTDLVARAEKITLVSDDHALLERLDAQGCAALRGRATIARSQPYYLDMTDLCANKGAAVRALARMMDVPIEEVAVIGDMANDLPMFAVAGLSIAMGQAPPEVRGAAQLVTTSNEEDGVANAIDWFLLD